MGIPIGWNIKREEAKEKDVLRADVTGQRSPIRRRVRPNRSPTSQGAFDMQDAVSTTHSSRLDSIARALHTRTRLLPPPVPEVSRTAYASGRNDRHRPRLPRDLPRPRQSPYHDEFIQEERRMLDDERPLAALTPGFAPAAAAAARNTEADDVREPRDQHPSYINDRPHRAPPPRLTRVERYRAARIGVSTDADEGGHVSNENAAVSFPPLRRMGRRTIADGPLPSSSLRESWSPVSTFDGLGDRERSVSPFDEQLPWDTFLTTVVPDPVAPTAESSFASAAASASFSNSHPSSRAGSSNSATSSRTHLTVPSRRGSLPQNEQFMRACDTSEDDTASDTEEDEDEEVDVRDSIRRLNAADAARNRSGQHNSEPSRRRMRPSYFSNEPPMRDSERYSRRVLERTRDASAYVRSFYNTNTSLEDAEVERPLLSQLDGSAEESASNGEEEVPPLVPIASSPLDQELRDARSLVERLTRDPDISDDFWASVGLTRSFADPIERFERL
jgi:hypothetical protein